MAKKNNIYIYIIYIYIHVAVAFFVAVYLLHARFGREDEHLIREFGQGLLSQRSTKTNHDSVLH